MSEAKQSDSTDLLGQFLEAAKEAGVTRLIPTHPEDIRASLDAKDAEIAKLREVLGTADLPQFLTDVVTAAGLLSHGKKDKALAQRISDGAWALRQRALGPNEVLGHL